MMLLVAMELLAHPTVVRHFPRFNILLVLYRGCEFLLLVGAEDVVVVCLRLSWQPRSGLARSGGAYAANSANSHAHAFFSMTLWGNTQRNYQTADGA